ncbi:collagen-like protein [Allomuricauda sp. F6463D]|uniref:collagen-like protein n=1 Tax=Allomuricauda sp. F6463D TaxID=2926409 RepID=UPI001FF1C638|nr:collagen-like protein [Muricauda sp. F6463D]MCK0159854.1 collagen-like protein [Muricauda sp. F6463D]
MKTSKVLFFTCMIISSLIISCSGEDGEQGIKGKQGEQGIQGEKGPQGEVGQEGNANVKKLEWDLSLLPAGESSIEFNVPEFTAVALQNNSLIAHMEFFNGVDTHFYVLLPGRLQTLNLNFGIEYTEELLALRFYNADGTDGLWPQIPNDYTVILHITMVEVNPDAMAGKNSVAQDLKSVGIDIANYHEVMQYYGLE